MKIKISLLLGIVFLIGIISGTFPGECEKINFPNQDDVNFSIISNTSSMEGFNWSKIDYTIIYCFPTDIIPGNYSFSFSNYQDSIEIPPTTSSGGGGGGSTKIVNNTVIKEIPKYIDREVKVIKEGEKEIEKREKEKIILKRIILWWVIVGLTLFCIAFILAGVVHNLMKKKGK